MNVFYKWFILQDLSSWREANPELDPNVIEAFMNTMLTEHVRIFERGEF